MNSPNFNRIVDLLVEAITTLLVEICRKYLPDLLRDLARFFGFGTI